MKITISDESVDTEGKILDEMIAASGINLNELYDMTNYTIKFEYQINSAPVFNKAVLQILSIDQVLVEVEAEC